MRKKVLTIIINLGIILFFSTCFSFYIKNKTNITADVVVVNSTEADTILILVNQNSTDSIAVGRYYQERRGVPTNQIVYLNTTTSENITIDTYNSQIKEPVKSYLVANNLKAKIKYIVPTYGIPSKIDSNYAVDSYLFDLFDTKTSYTFYNGKTAADNSYYKGNWDTYSTGIHSSGSHFSSSSNTYLISRLDGTSLKIAKGLVDKALYASKYTGPAVNNKAYVYGQPYLNNANSMICGIITTAGYNCKQATGYPAYDSSYDPKLVPPKALNSNLGGDNPLWLVSPGNEYYDIWGNWRPGSIPIHFQSYTASYSIRNTDRWNQNVVANLLAADATATSGTVTEPTANGLPQPTLLFDYFLNGNDSEKHFNFAESYYMSLPLIKWTNIVIGDPLYKLADSPVIDDQPPKIDNQIHSCANNKANVYWSNKTAADGSPEVSYGSVKYGLTQTYGTEIWDETPLTYLGVSKKNYLSEHSFQINNIDCTKPYYFKINAIDPEGNISEQNFILNKPNDSPVLSTIGAKTINENTPLLFNVQSTDLDNDDLIYSISELPFGAAFNPTTQVFSWTPNYDQGKIGPYLITFSVNDQHGGIDSETVSITVNNITLSEPNIVIKTPQSSLTTMDSSITIFYTLDGESKTKTFPDLKAGDNQLSLTESNADSSITSTINFNVINKPPLNLSPTYFSTGWNMISFPDLSTAVTNGTLLPDTKVRQYDPKSNSYIKGEINDITLSPGLGYWIKLPDLNIVSGKRYALDQVTSTKVAVYKGWNLLGNPYQLDLPLSNLSVEYKDGSIRSYEDAINRKEVSGYGWSWEASQKQYFFIAINPDKYKTTARKQTVINQYRGLWMIIKSDQVNNIIFKK